MKVRACHLHEVDELGETGKLAKGGDGRFEKGRKLFFA
jgi:hypothetical protein